MKNTIPLLIMAMLASCNPNKEEVKPITQKIEYKTKNESMVLVTYYEDKANQKKEILLALFPSENKNFLLNTVEIQKNNNYELPETPIWTIGAERNTGNPVLVSTTVPFFPLNLNEFIELKLNYLDATTKTPYIEYIQVKRGINSFNHLGLHYSQKWKPGVYEIENTIDSMQVKGGGLAYTFGTRRWIVGKDSNLIGDHASMSKNNSVLLKDLQGNVQVTLLGNGYWPSLGLGSYTVTVDAKTYALIGSTLRPRGQDETLDYKKEFDWNNYFQKNRKIKYEDNLIKLD